MNPKVKVVFDYLSLGSALFGSPWIGAIAKLIMNRELTFDLTEDQRNEVLTNLTEKYQWKLEDSNPVDPK